MPTVRTPEAPCCHSPSRGARCCLLGSAPPTTIDFGAIFRSLAFRPTVSVYASQRPLPNATQDSVRGCWLGLAAVAISGACASRAFKAQPPQIRTCGFCRIRLLDRQLRYAPSRTRWSRKQAMATAIPTACLASSAIRVVTGDGTQPRCVTTGPSVGVPFPPRGLVGSIPPLPVL